MSNRSTITVQKSSSLHSTSSEEEIVLNGIIWSYNIENRIVLTTIEITH